jgi:hypothetical protein
VRRETKRKEWGGGARLTWRQTGATSEGSSHTTCHTEYYLTYKDRKTAAVSFISKCPATVCRGLKQRRHVVPLCPLIAERGVYVPCGFPLFQLLMCKYPEMTLEDKNSVCQKEAAHTINAV